MIRVLVADDHPVFRDGLRVLLESFDDITVAASAGDGQELLDLADRVPFDVAVVDLDMPGMDGAAATRRLRSSHPDAGVLVLTMHDDAVSVSRALAAGARGYVLKGSGHGAVARAIRAVADGDTVLGGEVGRVVRDSVSGAGQQVLFPGLSARESEILALVARGQDNHQVARALFLSVKTVQNHVSSLLAKTGASSRAHLVALARDAMQE